MAEALLALQAKKKDEVLPKFIFLSPQLNPKKIDDKKTPIVIGICGAPNSGKSLFVEYLRKNLPFSVSVLRQDNFYKPISGSMRRKKSKVPDSTEDIDDEVFRTYIDKYDFDVPEAIDWDFMEKGIDTLKCFKSFDSPIYDFDTKLRKDESEKVMPNECILLVGTLIFTMERIRKHMDLKIYIETDNDVRLSRRVKLEQVKFNSTYTLKDCLKRYTQFVKPATEKYVEPSKIYTDVIIPNYKFEMEGNDESKHMLLNLITNRCGSSDKMKIDTNFKL